VIPVRYSVTHAAWQARVLINGKVRHLGYFAEKRQAQAAVDAALEETTN
jgi:hypothetical protein